ncbi:biotin/lipoyl-binding protein [Urechidicola sp. KH5]
MLNISNNSINKKISLSEYKSGKKITNKQYYKRFNQISKIFLVLVMVILFLPWTQNISGRGYVTALKPSQRPQTIQSPIPGGIEQWYVQEGDFVKKGDTILRISEIKSDYFDDKLVERTGNQIEAKSLSVKAYERKILAQEKQINALQKEQGLKIEQAKNKLEQAKLKVKSDSIDLEVLKTNKTIATTRYNRIKTLKEEGLKSTRDVEENRLKLQATEAKFISQENKLLESKNKLVNARIELSRINTTYTDKISKAESELYTSKSAQFNTKAEVSKLENSYSNYEKRNTLKYVTAPQNGFINKALKAGVGETFKEGESLVTIMPANYDLAVETYIKPIDLPLIHIGEKVRVQFDGWPAIVFSGWESISYGTFGGKVVAIENFISDNGMYRVLLAQDEEDHPWPTGIRVGSGAKTIALLNDVPIWYELWRNINSFPPNFYKPTTETAKK